MIELLKEGNGLQQMDRGGVSPLQVINKNNQGRLRGGKNLEETAHKSIEPAFRVERGNRINLGLFPDDGL